MNTKNVPLSGYAIISIHAASQHLTPKEAPDEVRRGGMQFAWDWRITGTDEFEVLVMFAIEPDDKRPYFASVEVIGRFRQVNSNRTVEIEEFAQLQAVAILFPYVRQFLATLTLATESGAYHLPSVNVVALMKGINVKDATGAKQLAERAAQEQVSQPVKSTSETSKT